MDGASEAWRDVLVVDRIRSNINVEVDRARHVASNLRPDICVHVHVHVNPQPYDTRHQKKKKKTTDLVPNSF